MVRDIGFSKLIHEQASAHALHCGPRAGRSSPSDIAAEVAAAAALYTRPTNRLLLLCATAAGCLAVRRLT